MGINAVKEKIRDVMDFPKEGILFKDITTAIRDAKTLKIIVDYMVEQFKDKKIDYVVGIESRGFIFSTSLAYNLDAGVVLIRKPGKLPYKTIYETYDLEYGTDEVHMHIDAVEPGKNVLIVDDLLATGGTVSAACKLLKKAGANVVGTCFFIELGDLNGRAKIPTDVEVVSMITF